MLRQIIPVSNKKAMKENMIQDRPVGPVIIVIMTQLDPHPRRQDLAARQNVIMSAAPIMTLYYIAIVINLVKFPFSLFIL